MKYASISWNMLERDDNSLPRIHPRSQPASQSSMHTHIYTHTTAHTHTCMFFVGILICERQKGQEGGQETCGNNVCWVTAPKTLHQSLEKQRRLPKAICSVTFVAVSHQKIGDNVRYRVLSDIFRIRFLKVQEMSVQVQVLKVGRWINKNKNT